MEETVFENPFEAKIKTSSRIRYSCLVLGEIGKKYKIKLLEDYRSPGRNRQGAKNSILYIPKKSIQIPRKKTK